MRQYYKPMLLLLLVVATASCKKAFEDKPLELITDDYIWDAKDPSADQASKWVTNIYARIPTGYSRLNSVPLECVSDDAVPSANGNGSWNVIRGGYSASSTFDDNWSNCYAAIRSANLFLNNYQRVPWADSSRRVWFANEARALRAYFYYELIKRYGGIPLIGNKVFNPNDPELLRLQRNSFEECVNYVVSELDIVKDSLRADATLANRTTDPDYGRMRKSIVLSLKAKLLLQAASPLFNPSSTPEKAYTGYASYSADRWKAAADAAKAVMDLGLYDLEANRYNLVLNRANREHIFFRTSDSRVSNTYAYYMSPVGYTPGNTKSEGRVSPTQELVDAFPMANGKAITDPTSGYDAANPYIKRDPRLDQTIFYNGAKWLQRPVETFEGGRDKPNNAVTAPNQTQTGYYAKKFCANDSSSTNYTNTLFRDNGFTPAWCIIRYADILLMYAEAQNEYSGPDATVYNAVERIRQRAGLSPYTLSAGMNAVQMRELIRNERRVELAFEEQRFWDIRRWKIAKQVYGTMLHGVTVVKNTNGSFSYTRKDVVTPYFTDAMYLFPVALKETQVNTNLGQNPGY
ncbi:RagB/SusD family nutrient uptake outer membrane protein [Filimonas effusa]|uniref:RagB/SusD family nutrient uptake outer membrane protein n=1 Tax=Filimonas effusa TaxID=2508721 RepID=A0A4Q1D5J1_9BACT|nr:RagB/SusD family nutrient uptake outer membrane protein [Filimonas effusa]RXK83658.1 RagB/SusD family nutrient uptake outer membrane protein [Filimonas effusa]